MALITDLLTGKFLKFRLASGADVIAGTSEKHLVTPKSLKDAGLLNASSGSGGLNGGIMQIPFVLNQAQAFTVDATTYIAGYYYGIFPPATGSFKGKLYVYGNCDFGTLGQAVLWDGISNAPVPGSEITLNTVTANIKESQEFDLPCGRVYTYAIKRITPLNGRVFLKSALLIIK